MAKKEKNNKIRIGIILFLAILIYAIFTFFKPVYSDFGLPLKKITFGNNVINVEIADSDAVRSRGLMMRTFMHPNHGMLFVWPDMAPRTFWMRDTFIPLDMVFIDRDGKIVGIVENTQPHNISPVGVDQSSQYVLEIPAGDVKRFEMAVGKTLQLP